MHQFNIKFHWVCFNFSSVFIKPHATAGLIKFSSFHNNHRLQTLHRRNMYFHLYLKPTKGFINENSFFLSALLNLSFEIDLWWCSIFHKVKLTKPMENLTSLLIMHIIKTKKYINKK